MQNSPNNNMQIALDRRRRHGQGDARYGHESSGREARRGLPISTTAGCTRTKEVWGDQIFTTRDYREILARKDVDAVIIATPDHWHARITIDALDGRQGRLLREADGAEDRGRQAVIEAQKKTGRILQVGSQYAARSSIQKAKELLSAGAIGELNMVEAWLDRNTAIGAWQYSIPPDASPAERRLGPLPRQRSEASVRADPPLPLAQLPRLRHRRRGRPVRPPTHRPACRRPARSDPTRIYAAGGTRFWKTAATCPTSCSPRMDYPKRHAP